MPKTTAFGRFLVDVEGAITATSSSGTGQHLRRRPLLRELLEWVILRQSPSELLTLRRGFKSRFATFEDKRDRAAVALHLIHGHGLTSSRAAKLLEIPVSMLVAVTSIGDRGGLPVKDLVRNVADDVRTVAEGHLERLSVSLDQRAVEDLLLAALEAYAVPKPGRGQKYTEAYGICFGTSRKLPENGHEKRFRQILNVVRVATQLRSRATASEVAPNPKSEKVHLQVASSLFEHLTVLGDYHTHPYPTLVKLRSVRGWQPSNADKDHISVWASAARQAGGYPRFSLIAAVARGRKTGLPTAREAPNRVRFCIGGHFVVVSAYRLLRNDEYDTEIMLSCPGISSMTPS